MSYGVIIPATSEHFSCVTRLCKSMQQRLTDREQLQLCIVTNNESEQSMFRSVLNSFVPEFPVTVLSMEHLIRMQRFNMSPEVTHNVFNRPHFHYNCQSLKTLLAAVHLDCDQVFVLPPDSYVYREMSIWDDIIKVYLDHPRHFAYVSPLGFLSELIAGSARLLGINREAIVAYNYEYQDIIFEKDLLQSFLAHITEAAGVNNYFDAIHATFFGPTGGGVFFESMAYRYYLEQQNLQSNPRVADYQFLDSFDALSQAMPDSVLAAARPREHPIERLGNWLRPATVTGIQLFVRMFHLRMLRLERSYPQPWLVRHFLQTTPEIKLLVGSLDYELFL